MDDVTWPQLTLQFSRPAEAEQHALPRLAAVLEDGVAKGHIARWWFIRKQRWRFRYEPTSSSAGRVTALLRQTARHMQEQGMIARWATTLYEPETAAFGGVEAMRATHDLFHTDSRHIVGYLSRTGGDPSEAPVHRRELSVLLCVALMRAAGQEWYEQGDIWQRVSRLRPTRTATAPDQWGRFQAAVHHLLTVDTRTDSALRAGTLHFADDWFTAFEQAGRILRALADDGVLTRGLRATLAHHVIFHWNRIGLPSQAQASLVHAATQVVFGDAETYEQAGATSARVLGGSTRTHEATCPTRR